MANIYKGTLGLIGNTPLVEVTNIEKELGLKARVLVKLEYFNPAGSVKDRIAKEMIEDAEEKGLLMGKALLPAERSGKVKIGQTVNVSFDNFPNNEFGIVKGVIKNISLVPSEIEKKKIYIVEILLPKGLITSYNKELPYLLEMEGKAEIITDDLSLLERFLLPIKKVLKENL